MVGVLCGGEVLAAHSSTYKIVKPKDGPNESWAFLVIAPGHFSNTIAVECPIVTLAFFKDAGCTVPNDSVLHYLDGSMDEQIVLTTPGTITLWQQATSLGGVTAVEENIFKVCGLETYTTLGPKVMKKSNDGGTSTQTLSQFDTYFSNTDATDCYSVSVELFTDAACTTPFVNAVIYVNSNVFTVLHQPFPTQTFYMKLTSRGKVVVTRQLTYTICGYEALATSNATNIQYYLPGDSSTTTESLSSWFTNDQSTTCPIQTYQLYSDSGLTTLTTGTDV